MSSNTSPKRPFDSYLKYSGMAFQFLGAAIAGLLLGKWLDKTFSMKSPVFTVSLSLFFVAASLVLVIRELLKKK